MTNPTNQTKGHRRVGTLCGLVCIFVAVAFWVGTGWSRVRRIEEVSRIGLPAVADPTWHPALIIPGHRNDSYEWLDGTAQLLALHQARLRHVDYENSPLGHDISSSSPYRWWLGALAIGAGLATGRPAAHELELAGLWSDPLIRLLLITITGVVAARRFGLLAAAVLVVGSIGLFPLAAAYLPGTPSSDGLSLGCEMLGLLLLLPRARSAPASAGRNRMLFTLAGGVASLGVWVSAHDQLPMLGGIVLGGGFAAFIRTRATGQNPGITLPDLPPWRLWSVGGAVGCLVAYGLEYYPDKLGGWDLGSVHPLDGAAWLGAGELLHRLSLQLAGHRAGSRRCNAAILGLSLVALLSLPVALWRTHSSTILAVDPHFMRLSGLPDSPVAPSLWALLVQNGVTPGIWATLVPLAAILPAAVVLARSCSEPAYRVGIALALGPLLVALGLATQQVSWFDSVDVVLLVLSLPVVAALVKDVRLRPLLWWGGCTAAASIWLGVAQLWPAASLQPGRSLSETDAISLVERDLARWLMQQDGSDAVTVVAPPDATIALYYYGGIRGLGTFARDNRDGLRAVVRIISATTPEEARELIEKHGVNDLVIPNWDPYMDEFAKMGEGEVEGTFLERLNKWELPPWLRPVPYLLPSIPGFDERSVTILNVVDDQKDAVAASRLVEYFVDMGERDLAASSASNLRKFPGSPSAALAEAELTAAFGNKADAERALELLTRRTSAGADRSLPWDQKVRLAIVWARNRRIEAARRELQQSLAEIDEARLRLLSTKTLVRFHLLRTALDLEINDAALRSVEKRLLPWDAQVQPVH